MIQSSGEQDDGSLVPRNSEPRNKEANPEEGRLHPGCSELLKAEQGFATQKRMKGNSRKRK